MNSKERQIARDKKLEEAVDKMQEANDKMDKILEMMQELADKTKAKTKGKKWEGLRQEH